MLYVSCRLSVVAQYVSGPVASAPSAAASVSMMAAEAASVPTLVSCTSAAASVSPVTPVDTGIVLVQSLFSYELVDGFLTDVPGKTGAKFVDFQYHYGLLSEH